MPFAPKILSRKKHLVLVQHEGWQELEDFQEIKKIIEQTSTDIEVFIANSQVFDRELLHKAATNPTLIVSPSHWLGAASKLRGKVHKGAAIDKDKQLKQMEEHSVPGPKWALIDPNLKPTSDEWGDFLLIKPAHFDSSQGKNVSIVPTSAYKYRKPTEYPDGHMGRKFPMLLQRFIITGRTATNYRVNTLHGEPLYCLKRTRITPLLDLQNLSEESFSDTIATNVKDPAERGQSLVGDEDILELARKCHRCFPNVPLKGVDIIREEDTGNLFVLELNCAGNTWHISSDFARHLRIGECTKEKMVSQFGAWEVAAKALIKHTRLEAV